MKMKTLLPAALFVAALSPGVAMAQTTGTTASSILDQLRDLLNRRNPPRGAPAPVVAAGLPLAALLAGVALVRRRRHKD